MLSCGLPALYVKRHPGAPAGVVFRKSARKKSREGQKHRPVAQPPTRRAGGAGFQPGDGPKIRVALAMHLRASPSGRQDACPTLMQRKRLSCRPPAESRLQTDNTIISRASPVNCSRWLGGNLRPDIGHFGNPHPAVLRKSESIGSGKVYSLDRRHVPGIAISRVRTINEVRVQLIEIAKNRVKTVGCFGFVGILKLVNLLYLSLPTNDLRWRLVPVKSVARFKLTVRPEAASPQVEPEPLGHSVGGLGQSEVSTCDERH